MSAFRLPSFVGLFRCCVFLVWAGACSGIGHAADEQPKADPNPVFRLTAVNITGNSAVSLKDIRKMMKLSVPARIHDSRVGEATENVLKGYRGRGFLKVAISTVLAGDGDGKALSMSIVEGSVFYLGTLRVEGNEELPSATILREIEMRPGDVLNQNKLFESNKRLYASGCFDIVNFAMSTAPVNRMNLVVKVHERKQRFFKGSVGYGSQDKERVSTGYEDRNFFGGTRQLDIKYTFSGFITDPPHNRTTLLDATVVQPFIFNTRMEGRLGYEREGQLRQAYDSITNTISTSLERRLNAELSLRGTYRFAGTYLSRVSPDALTPSETSIDAVGGILRFDNTDDPFLPYQGWRSITLFEEGMELYRTDVGFHKFESRLGRFDTFTSGWTFFEGFQFGHIRPWSGKSSDAIPIYERYFLGGANTVRGYSERSLGPKDSDGNPLGGTLFMVANFEVRHEIYKQVFGVLFFDGGNLFAYDPGNSSTNVRIRGSGAFKYGTGPGIRYHSPIGAIRLELGYQLNPDGNPSTLDRFAVDFSIGEVF